MDPNIAAALGRKRSGLAAVDGTFVTAGLVDADDGVDRQSGRRYPDRDLAACLAAFVLGSVAQGAPFVLVAAELDRRDIGAGWLAAVAAVRLAPYLVCSPPAGALAGRYQARSLFAATGLARCAVVVALWIGLGAGAPAAALVALLFVLVAIGTPTFPALMRAVHQLTTAARVDRTSTLAAGLESAAFCAGPALGGLLLLTGTTSSVLVCAAMLAASAAVATSLPTTDVTTRPNGGRASRPVRRAGRCLFALDVRTAFVAVLGVNVLAGLNAALLVRLPAGLDLGGERAFGVLSLVYGLGAFGAFIALLSPIRRGRRPLLPLVATGAAVALLSATDDLRVAVVACTVMGASVLTAEVLVMGALGHSLPGALIAPAFGVLDALMVAAMVGGSVVAPVLTGAFGLRATLAVVGIGMPVLAVGTLRLHGRGGR